MYDHPRAQYYEQIGDVFRLGTPCGVSPILAIHSWDQMTRSPYLRMINDGMTNMFCFCQGTASNILRRHRNFAAVLNCLDPVKEQEILYSLDGTYDYIG